MLKSNSISIVAVVLVIVIGIFLLISNKKNTTPVEVITTVPEVTTTVVPADGVPATVTEVTPLAQ